MMKSLINKRVVLGITGSIAAYKGADLVRRLCEAGAIVQVVMTQSATEFVTPLTFQALSGRPVRTQLLDLEEESGMGHITLARWADVVLIAPASANTLANIASGKADDLLTTICLATDAPVALAPAMNRVMWENAATQANVLQLKARGIQLFGPGLGGQACGETGEGRMLEPVELVNKTAHLFKSGVLSGVQVVITAGPTQEMIDPVRYLSNRSSGKMGYAVARAAIEAGASVSLISGPVNLTPPDGVHYHAVLSASDMHEAVMSHVAACDVFIGCAAVADFTPRDVGPQKIKKQSRNDGMTLDLVETTDILAAVAALTNAPFSVGFAAETEQLEAYARVKLEKKSLDMVVANQVGNQQGGFDGDDNALTVLWRDGLLELPMMHKEKLARELINIIATRYHEKNTDKDS